jgi:hypothetical protein
MATMVSNTGKKSIAVALISAVADFVRGFGDA